MIVWPKPMESLKWGSSSLETYLECLILLILDSLESDLIEMFH